MVAKTAIATRGAPKQDTVDFCPKVTLKKEHRLVRDENAIVWGNEYEKSKTYEVVGPVTQQFVVNGANDK
jgi:hypothetical protein